VFEDADRSVGVDGLHDLSQGDTVSEALLKLNNLRDLFVDDVFDPLFGFTNVTQIFVGLQKLTLAVHPLAGLPTTCELAGAFRALALLCCHGAL
jgi:hypothetical protein